MKRKFSVTTEVRDVKGSAVDTMILADSLGDALLIVGKKYIQNYPQEFISQAKDVTAETSANYSDVLTALVDADIRPAAVRAIMETLSDAGYFDFEELDFPEREYINGICVFWPMTGEVDFDYVRFSSISERCDKKAEEIADAYWQISPEVYVIHRPWAASYGEDRIRRMFEDYVAQEIPDKFITKKEEFQYVV